ncbi:MAG: hypothetical protein ABIH09_02710 [Candidatus Omnitrophota bacterium]
MIILIWPKEMSGYSSTGNREREISPISPNAAKIIIVVMGRNIENLDKLIAKL